MASLGPSLIHQSNYHVFSRDLPYTGLALLILALVHPMYGTLMATLGTPPSCPAGSVSPSCRARCGSAVSGQAHNGAIHATYSRPAPDNRYSGPILGPILDPVLKTRVRTLPQGQQLGSKLVKHAPYGTLTS